MNFMDLDVYKLIELVKPLLEQVTCINCCTYYSDPSTSVCGHTLCHIKCWRYRATCPECRLQVDKKTLRSNSAIQTQTEHAVALAVALESLYNINIDELSQETQEKEKYVKKSLYGLENRCSASVTDSEQFTETAVPSVQQVTSDVQIHTENMKPKIPQKAIAKLNVQQDDWDKIEVIPETESITKNPVGPMDIETFDCITDERDFNVDNPQKAIAKLNVQQDDWDKIEVIPETESITKNPVGPMDIETFDCITDERDLNVDNPRRSLRNKEVNTPAVINDVSSDKSGNSYKTNSDQIKLKSGQNWKNVKKMKKEFSKLKKNNKNKLNISIEMAKTSKLSAKKDTPLKPQNHTDEKNKEIDKDIQKSAVKTSKVSFFKRAPLLSTEINEHANCTTSDDIEITIKIGKSLTKFKIQKKENDTMQLKVKTDREVQTSLGDMENEHNMCSSFENSQAQQVENKNNNNGYTVKDPNMAVVDDKNVVNVNIDSVSTKCSTSKAQGEKSNTTSADTSTAHFDISESEERGFAELMDVIPSVSKNDKNESQKASEIECTLKSKSEVQLSLQNLAAIHEGVDIFKGECVKENNRKVQNLESAKSPSSAILMRTAKSKSRSQKINIKRTRDTDNAQSLSTCKKMKVTQEITTNDKNAQRENILEVDSENINYDAVISQVISQVFASINMENLQKTLSTQLPTQISDNQKSSSQNFVQPGKPNKLRDNKDKTITQKTNTKAIEKCSEKVFSLMEKENSSSEIIKTTWQKPGGPSQPLKNKSQISLQQPNDDGAKKNEEILASQHNLDYIDFGTPIRDDDDKSVVEETPQKNAAISKIGDKNELSTSAECATTGKNSYMNETGARQNDMDTQDSINVITISSESKVSNSKEIEVTRARKTTSETPLSMANADKIQKANQSTPIARKSLNLDQENADNDPEETIFPTGSVVPATTTQQREFLCKAFEQTLDSPSQTLGGRQRRPKKLCLAGTRLGANETAILKQLCARKNWTFVDTYTDDLTHLVISVDEDNVVQRTVKYVCALASGKWIVSYAWVERCIQINGIADEEPFEVLDSSGEPGPRRSRLAKQKLLRGLTFYCMPPFTIIDVKILKDVLVAAGGRVLQSPREASAADAPAVLLAEPEHAQQDQFIYMAKELKMVPVIYEWVFDCLGEYTLKPVSDLLLCPASLLPPAVARWPPELLASSCDE